MEKYGERLKAIRRVRGLTQTELAEKLGITQKSYQRMESGNHDLKMSTIYQLCTTLNISADWLMGLKADAPKIYEIEIPYNLSEKADEGTIIETNKWLNNLKEKSK